MFLGLLYLLSVPGSHTQSSIYSALWVGVILSYHHLHIKSACSTPNFNLTPNIQLVLCFPKSTSMPCPLLVPPLPQPSFCLRSDCQPSSIISHSLLTELPASILNLYILQPRITDSNNFWWQIISSRGNVLILISFSTCTVYTHVHVHIYTQNIHIHDRLILQFYLHFSTF